MNFISPQAWLEKANKNYYAIGAFNILNLETLQGVIKAGESSKIPLIIQITPGALKWANYDYLVPMVTNAIKKSKGQFILHLDHCQDLNLLEKAMQDGFNSVMFDGSHWDYAQNVAMSQQAVALARKYKVFIEVEIGKIGGKEDDLNVENAEIFNELVIQKFYEQTKPDSLAFAFGTAHGVYSALPKLDFTLVAKTKALLPVPLVMHGSSGLSPEAIQKAVSLGINKVNVGTDLLIAYQAGVQAYLHDHPNAYDVRKINTQGIEKITQRVLEYLNLFGYQPQ